MAFGEATYWRDGGCFCAGVIGAGGHSNVIEDTLVELGLFNEIAFLDDKFNNSSAILSSENRKILGPAIIIPND